MSKSRLPVVLSALCLIAVLVMGYFAVSAMDRTRFEIEKLQESVRRLDEKISMRPIGSALPGTERKSAVPRSSAFANVRFYAGDSVPGGRLITVQSADTKNMNYLLNNDAAISTLWGKAYDELASRGFEQIDRMEPLMAESWSRSEDSLRYRIKLRRGMLWHDFTDPVSGKKWENVEVTAHDYKFYIDVVKNPNVDCLPLRTFLQDIESVRVFNDYEFEVTWKKRYFLSEMVTLGLIPLPRHLYHAYPGPFDPERFNNDHERNRIIVGCGPYRFEKWDKGRRIIMKRWEKYFGAAYGAMPPLEYYVVEIIQHPNTRLQALQSKAIDEMTLTPEQWLNRTDTPDFAQGGFLKKLKKPSMVYNYIGFNLKKSMFQDAATRVALSHLVNRKRIIHEVYYDLARPVSGPFFPDSEAYDRSVAPYSFSVEEAKRLLSAAGWKDLDGDGILERNGEKLRFTLMFPNVNTIYQRMLPMIKEDMGKAGVQMDLLGLEWSVCIQRIEKKSYDACALAWLNTLLPDPYQLWHSSQAKLDGSSNHVGFSDPAADRLIEQIRVTFDPEARKKLYHEFHRMMHREQPYIFLFSPYDLSAINNRYRNMIEFPLGIQTNILWTPRAQQMSVPGL